GIDKPGLIDNGHQPDEEEEAKLTDGNGTTVPRKLRPVFLGREDFARAESLLLQATRIVETILAGPHGSDLRRQNPDILNRLNKAKKDISWSKPYAVCSACEESAKPSCNGCKGTGWLVKSINKQSESRRCNNATA